MDLILQYAGDTLFIFNYMHYVSLIRTKYKLCSYSPRGCSMETRGYVMDLRTLRSDAGDMNYKDVIGLHVHKLVEQDAIHLNVINRVLLVIIYVVFCFSFFFLYGGSCLP